MKIDSLYQRRTKTRLMIILKSLYFKTLIKHLLYEQNIWRVKRLGDLSSRSVNVCADGEEWENWSLHKAAHPRSQV
jgi:hypothetical protein